MLFRGSSFLTRFWYYSTSLQSFLSIARRSFTLARRSIRSLIYTGVFSGNIQQQCIIRWLLPLQTLQVGLQSLLQCFRPFGALLQGFREYERVYIGECERACIRERERAYIYYNSLLECFEVLSLPSPLSLLVLLEANAGNIPLVTFLLSLGKTFYISTLRSSNTFFYYNSLYLIFSLQLQQQVATYILIPNIESTFLRSLYQSSAFSTYIMPQRQASSNALSYFYSYLTGSFGVQVSSITACSQCLQIVFFLAYLLYLYYLLKLAYQI